MGKIFWLDSETVGTDPQRHCLIQLGYIIEIDGEVKEEGSIISAPFPECEIEQEALDVHGRSREEIAAYQPPAAAFKRLVTVLSKYVDRYDKADKFVPAGYFVAFDTGMLRSFFTRNDDPYYGSWFTSVSIDVASWVALEVAQGLKLPNHKLTTLCERYGIQINAHDALSDIRATRRIFELIQNGGKA